MAIHEHNNKLAADNDKSKITGAEMPLYILLK
nr:MAG TPA: hypothetical protein [Caudoviricetes sp.]